MRQWKFIADMNLDGIVTAADWWLWSKWIFFYPGDWIVQWMMKHAPVLARGLELSLDSFGGAGSGVMSLWVFMAATMACESSVLKPVLARRLKRVRPARRPHTHVVLGTHMRRRNNQPAKQMFGRQAPW